MAKKKIEIKWLSQPKERDYLAEALRPLLLVREPANGKVIIVDSFHRLCAIHSYDEDYRSI